MQRSRTLPETLVKSSVLRTVDGRALEWDVGRWMAPADHVDEVAVGPGHRSRSRCRLRTGTSRLVVAQPWGRGLGYRHLPDGGPARSTSWRSGGAPIDLRCGARCRSVAVRAPARRQHRHRRQPPESLATGRGVLSKRGRLLVETVHPQQPSEDLHVRVETAVSSGPWFRWSVVSHLDVATLAGSSGFHVHDTWEDEGRYFAQLERISES